MSVGWGISSLRGRRSKGKGKGIRARDHARGRREEGNAVPFLSPSRAPRALTRQNSPFPFPFNACHAGYGISPKVDNIVVQVTRQDL